MHDDLDYDPPVKGTHPPPIFSDTCIMWLQDRCRLGYACRYVHGDLEYATSVCNLLRKQCLCQDSKCTDAEIDRCTSPNSSGTTYKECLLILLYLLGVSLTILFFV